MPITPQELLFYSFGAVTVGAAVAVILVRNPVHAVLNLVLAFFSSAALWLLLEAEFLGIALVLVYVGAVMVLFLFVVMMLDINVAKLKQGYTRYAPLGAVVTLIMAGEIGYVVWGKHLGIPLMGEPAKAAGASNTQMLGQQMYTHYVLPFEIASVILLLGIVAAIALTMRRRADTRHQDPAEQVRVRREDRVRLVKMPAEDKR